MNGEIVWFGERGICVGVKENGLIKENIEVLLYMVHYMLWLNCDMRALEYYGLS